MTVKLNDVINTYIKMRDELAARNKAHKEDVAGLKATMEKLELHIQTKMNDVGTDSLKVDGNTAFKAMKDSVTIQDSGEFKSYLYENILTAFQPWRYKTLEGEWQPDGESDLQEHVASLLKSDVLSILTLSANKNSCKEYMDENKGILPDGVQYRQEVSIQIRKGK